VSGGIALDLNVGTDPDVCAGVALKDLPGASGHKTGGTLAVSIESLPYRVEVEPVRGRPARFILAGDQLRRRVGLLMGVVAACRDSVTA
jgi:hypothetical protein